MLKKLRRKFVALIMAILAFVLTMVFGVACYMDWQTSASDAEEMLSSSIMQASETKAFDNGGGRFRMLGSMPDAPRMGNRHGVDAAVAVYIETNGELQHVPESRGMLNDSLADEAQSKVADAPDGFGTLGNLGLIYMKSTEGGVTYVAFADDDPVEGWKGLLLTLLAIEAIVLVVFLFISMAFARWALKPVEVAWDKQRKFIADASHELKTPLSIISANTSILMDEPDMPAPERRRWLESSMNAADGMQSLLDEMLDLASMEDSSAAQGDHGGEAETNDADSHGGMEECNLSRMAMACSLQFESVSYERNFALDENIADDVHALAIEDNLRKVMDILMDNACKYVDKGGDVSIEVRSTGTDAMLSVSNTGTVIPPEDLERVFDRFYRADESRTSGGHGLGLSIARQLAQEMGGTLAVQSGDGKTTFTLKLKAVQ